MKYLLTISSAGEAFFCGFMQVVLFSVIAFVVSLIKNKKKDKTEE